jgi:hypothetical protein
VSPAYAAEPTLAVLLVTAAIPALPRHCEGKDELGLL